jgi:hypothetical protein
MLAGTTKLSDLNIIIDIDIVVYLEYRRTSCAVIYSLLYIFHSRTSWANCIGKWIRNRLG